MAEKTYPIVYKGIVVGQVKFTDIDFRPADELVTVLNEQDQIEEFEVPAYA